jgi:hypothetical protein
MKEYPVTSRELWTLGGLQLGAGVSFSVAAWLLGVYISSKQALSFAGKDTAAKVVGQWEGYASMSWYGCIALAVLGLILFAISALNVRGIIRETTHGA